MRGGECERSRRAAASFLCRVCDAFAFDRSRFAHVVLGPNTLRIFRSISESSTQMTVCIGNQSLSADSGRTIGKKKVWSRSFIDREAFGIARKQINNTPHRIVHIENDICLYTVMSVCIAYPCLLKNRQIFSVRISEILSLNYYVAIRSG